MCKLVTTTKTQTNKRVNVKNQACKVTIKQVNKQNKKPGESKAKKSAQINSSKQAND